MTEILTESFCERCGTRYTFESSVPRQRRLASLKVLGRGLKSFVLSDDSSLDEAIAGARADEERRASGHQLDAFHKTFSFCMSCRQYTCANCWNALEARCLSCAPFEVSEAAPAFEAEHVHVAEVDPERLIRLMGEPAAASSAQNDVPAAPGEPEGIVQDVGAVQEGPAIGGMEPGESLEDAIAAFEAGLEVEAREAGGDFPLPLEVVETAVETAEPAAESAPEPVAAVAEPDVEPEPETAATPGVDVVAQPAWPAWPASPPGAAEPVHAPLTAPAAPAPSSGPPQWPSGPRWPTGIPAGRSLPAPDAPPPPVQAGDPLAALISRTSTEAMWAASSREILQPAARVQPTPTIRACGTCGISLSATARFCRRCGTAQET